MLSVLFIIYTYMFIWNIRCRYQPRAILTQRILEGKPPRLDGSWIRKTTLKYRVWIFCTRGTPLLTANAHLRGCTRMTLYIQRTTIRARATKKPWRNIVKTHFLHKTNVSSCLSVLSINSLFLFWPIYPKEATQAKAQITLKKHQKIRTIAIF